jgi:hypothetical protein
MDLLTHMFDQNPQSQRNWQRVKRNDPNFQHLLVCIAKNQRDKRSISVADIAQVGIDIGKNTALKNLSIDDLYCLDHDNIALAGHMCGLLCEGINSNTNIEELTISNFSDNQWHIGQCLGPFLANNPNLRSVCLMTGGGYTRSAENMRLLVEPLLERDGPLDELCFIEAGVNDDMVVALVDVFLKNPSLVPIKLEIAACEFGIIGCQALSKLIQSQSCQMETLDIVDNFLEDDAAICLADALKTNRGLKQLCLAGNRITPNGWKVFDNTTSCYVSDQYEEPFSNNFG